MNDNVNQRARAYCYLKDHHTNASHRCKMYIDVKSSRDITVCLDALTDQVRDLTLMSRFLTLLPTVRDFTLMSRFLTLLSTKLVTN